MSHTRLLLAGAALLAFIPGVAMAGQATEVGYQPGALGVSAILEGDYAKAAARLSSMEGTTAGDPARLINLGHAYKGLGRYQDAERAYRAAIKAMPVELMTADGNVVLSRTVARQGLERLPRSFAAR